MTNTVTFRSETYDEDGNLTGTIEHVFEGESYLPEMLYNFKSFLQGMGFNYVTNVYSVKSDGEEVGEE